MTTRIKQLLASLESEVIDIEEVDQSLVEEEMVDSPELEVADAEVDENIEDIEALDTAVEGLESIESSIRASLESADAHSPLAAKLAKVAIANTLAPIYGAKNPGTALATSLESFNESPTFELTASLEAAETEKKSLTKVVGDFFAKMFEGIKGFFKWLMSDKVRLISALKAKLEESKNYDFSKVKVVPNAFTAKLSGTVSDQLKTSLEFQAKLMDQLQAAVKSWKDDGVTYIVDTFGEEDKKEGDTDEVEVNIDGKKSKSKIFSWKFSSTEAEEHDLSKFHADAKGVLELLEKHDSGKHTLGFFETIRLSRPADVTGDDWDKKNRMALVKMSVVIKKTEKSLFTAGKDALKVIKAAKASQTERSDSKELAVA